MTGPAAAAIFASPGPRVFAMPPGARFVDALAQGLAAAIGRDDDPFALSRAVVLTPTRRAARALELAFARASGEGGGMGAALLPAIRALADVEEDEEPFEPGEIALELPPALSASQRRFELAALAHAMARARDADADPASALPLADALGRLLDDVASEGGADMTAVEALFDRLPAHLQDAAHFLEIVLNAWPARLAELGKVDNAARRDALMRRLAQAWTDDPPAHPVIAAGSTGTVPATAGLLRVVAGLPQGCVVLPGLDAELDDAAWDQIDDQHPQAGMKRLLAGLGVDRATVRPWPEARESRVAGARRRVVNEALRPADATADWIARVEALRARGPGDPVAEGLEGLTVIEAADEDAEARVIALAMREALEDPSATALFVTPDRGLAQRVETALRRWNVEAEASLGAPVSETPAGVLGARVLELAQDPGDPVALASLLKHPSARFGLSEQRLRTLAAALERAGLRGVRAGEGFDALVARLEASPEARLKREGASADALGALIADIDEALSAFAPLREGTHALAEFARAHALAIEAVAKAPEASGAERAWAGADGEAEAGLFAELLSDTGAFPDCDLESYARIVSALSNLRAVRPAPAPGARARILGPLEARLQSADLVVLGGLNEGTWPAAPPQDPFLSAQMRAAAGLAPNERRYGLAAHDFAQLACAPRALVTRANRVEGAPSVASRWLWRLQTLALGAGVEIARAGPGAADIARLAPALDRVEASDAKPIAAPSPRPPVAARPRRMSASRVRDWIRDPYAIYGRLILGLEPLDPLDRPPDARERGIALHEALFAALEETGEALPADFARDLARRAEAELAARGLAADAMARLRPRLDRAARWFADFETARRADGWTPALLEHKGEAVLNGPAGPFALHARADRIDRGPHGWAVLDYKTGTPPTAAQVAAFLEPQLPVEAAILAAGGFDGAPAEPPAQLLYVRVSGGRSPGSAVDLAEGRSGRAPDALAREAREGLERLIASFDRETTAYRSQPRAQYARSYGDYDRLARRKEWASQRAEDAA